MLNKSRLIFTCLGTLKFFSDYIVFFFLLLLTVTNIVNPHFKMVRGKKKNNNRQLLFPIYLHCAKKSRMRDFEPDSRNYMHYTELFSRREIRAVDFVQSAARLSAKQLLCCSLPHCPPLIFTCPVSLPVLWPL